MAAAFPIYSYTIFLLMIYKLMLSKGGSAMTQCERQVLQLIETDPMISQQEIADRLGITQSSAAAYCKL